ncbi:MAG TPA: hypothetical protein VIA80_01110, partial [Hyphomonadaceae bacterium]
STANWPLLPQLALRGVKRHLRGLGQHRGVTPMRKLIMAALIAAPLLLTACNTIAGLGKDVGAVGDAVSDSAEKSK